MRLLRTRMTVIGVMLLVTCIAPGAAIIAVFWRLCVRATTLPPTTGWIDDFSVDRYLPMLRLLNDTDLHFLRSQPNIRPKLAAQFRRERCGILRGYLRLLATDFRRVVAGLRLVMTQARSDRPDLAALLIRSQATFAAYMALAHVQLLLYGFGVGTVSVDVPLKIFEGMRLELRSLVPQTVASAV